MRQRNICLTMTTGGHNKFWRGEVRDATRGATLWRCWGKIGTEGQSTTDAFSSFSLASAQLDKLVEQKKAKGYIVEKAAKEVKPAEAEKPNWHMEAICKCGHERKLHRHLLACQASDCDCRSFNEAERSHTQHPHCTCPHESWQHVRTKHAPLGMRQCMVSSCACAYDEDIHTGGIFEPRPRPSLPADEEPAAEPAKPRTLADLRARYSEDK